VLLAVIADSHDNLPLLKEAVTLALQRRAERIVHCGDIVAPFSARILIESGLPVLAVFGNNDGERQGLRKIIQNISEPPLLVNLSGKSFIIYHEPPQTFPENVDFILYGHTHKVYQNTLGKTLVLNPGECGGWLFNSPTIAFLDTLTLKTEIVTIPL
jgi:putative phosphoesterase